MNLELSDLFIIAENDLYRFGVGCCNGRWLGFALEGEFSRRVKQAFAAEGMAVDPHCTFVFPEVADNFELGMTDRDKAILLTGALAQDLENGYGGVEKWHVPPNLRGDPEKFRCGHCERVGCDGRECQDCDGGYDD